MRNGGDDKSIIQLVLPEISSVLHAYIVVGSIALYIATVAAADKDQRLIIIGE